MEEFKRAVREARALKAFVVGTMVLCIGLVSLKKMDTFGLVFWLCFTPFAFLMSFYYWRTSRRREKAPAYYAGPEPTRRNPPPVLPPRRDQL